MTEDCLVYLAVSEDFYGDEGGPEDWNRHDAAQKVIQEYLVKFAQVSTMLYSFWGPPDFQATPEPTAEIESYDAASETFFPSLPYADEEPNSLEAELYWQGAIALNYWQREDQLIYLCLEHADTEAPVCLYLGIRTMVLQ